MSHQDNQVKGVLPGDWDFEQGTARFGAWWTHAVRDHAEHGGQVETVMLHTNISPSIRFEAYIDKSAYKMAGVTYSCQANAVLGGASQAEAHKALLYGRHLGIAYQLVDDILDFVSLDDLKLGFATAPVFFAAEEFPHLHTMITRRLSTC